MSFGWGGGGLTQAEDAWNAYLKKLQAQKQAYQGTGYDPRYAAARPGGTALPATQDFAPSPTVAPVGQTITPSTGGATTPAVRAAVTPAAASASTTAATGGTATGGAGSDGKISNDLVTRKGQFYSDYPGTSIGALAADPGAAARKWAGFYKQGGNAFGNYMANILKDPTALLKGMGVQASSLVDPQDQLDWQRRLWDIASGRQKVGGEYGYMSGRGIIENVLNAKMDNQAGSLGSMLNDPDLTPDQQVGNTIQLLMGSLQSIVSPDALQAYQSTLGRLGQEFIDMKMKDPKSWAKLPFNQFLKQRLGTGGGIY